MRISKTMLFLDLFFELPGQTTHTVTARGRDSKINIKIFQKKFFR